MAQARVEICRDDDATVIGYAFKGGFFKVSIVMSFVATCFIGTMIGWG